MSFLASIFLGFISRNAIVYWWFANPQSHSIPFKTGPYLESHLYQPGSG
jgi:hypothetical protein